MHPCLSLSLLSSNAVQVSAPALTASVSLQCFLGETLSGQGILTSSDRAAVTSEDRNIAKLAPLKDASTGPFCCPGSPRRRRPPQPLGVCAEKLRNIANLEIAAIVWRRFLFGELVAF